MKQRNYFNLSERIMQRVYLIWFSREVLPYVLVEGVLLQDVSRIADAYVSFGNVWGNLISTGGVQQVVVLLASAIRHVEFTALSAIVASLVLTFWLLRNILKIRTVLTRRTQGIVI